MKISSFAHKGIKRLYSEDIAKGVPPDTVDKLRRSSRFLTRCRMLTNCVLFANWKVHTLTGDRKGTWSLSVTRNRRLTFTIDDEREICDLNLEDYH
jgi:proteic killer suppression protein